MADIISRLKLESGEFDSKIKRAGQELLAYSEHCKKMGLEMGYANRDAKEFAKQLGGMETVSKTARGKINELTEAFTNLKVMYNSMTDAERNGEFGKNLAASLDQLKTRINDSKIELKGVESELGGGLSDTLDKVTSKFGLSIGQLTGWGAALGATKVALDVAKDAFFQSESNIDEWGRTVKGAEGAYDIFLQTLNNGNWSNFFSNLSQAITGARDLYDAFDRLNSIKANNAVAIAMTQAEIQQLRLLKQQGQNVDDKIKEATARLKTLQSQSTNAGINAGKSQVVNTLRNGVNSIGGTPINNVTLNRVADNISKQGQAYFDYMKRRAAALEKQGMVTKTQTINDSQGGTYERQYKVFDINKLNKEQQKQYAIAKVVTERETEIQKGLSVWGQAINEQASNAREQFRDNRYALQGSGGGSGKTNIEKDEFTEIIGLIGNAQERVRDFQKQISESWDNNEIVRLRKELKEAQNELDVLQGKLPKNTVADITIKVDDADALKKLSTIDDVTIDPKTMTVTADTTDALLKVQEMVSDTNGTIVSINVVPQITDEDIERSLLQQYGKPIEVPVVPKTTGDAIEQEIRVKLSEQNMDADMQTLRTLLETQIKNGIEGIEIPSDTLAQAIMGEGVDIPDEYWSNLQDQINEKLKELGIDPINIDFSTGKNSENSKRSKSDDSITKLSKGISGLNSITGGLEKMGIEIPSEIQSLVGVIEGVMAVIQGVQTIIGVTQFTAITANTVSLDLLTAAIWANTAASIIPFANGGIVPHMANGGQIPHAANGYFVGGTHYSGDVTPIMANAGELVLNRAQQNNLANALEGDNNNNVDNRQPYVNGEMIYLGLNNYLKRTGRGEIVVSKR